MKKIVLFSIVFIAASASAIAQEKISKKPATCQKTAGVPAKSAGPGQEKTAVPKNKKQLDLQSTKLQPAAEPAAVRAELKDERAN